MSDGIRTPEAAEGIQTPPTPVSAGGPVPKKTKGKPRAKAAASEKPTGLMAILWGIAVTAEVRIGLLFYSSPNENPF